MEKQYFYKLGHCPALGVAEYRRITGDDYKENKKYLLASKHINTQKTGSLVFGGAVVDKFPIKETVKENLYKTIVEYIKSQGWKKVGLALPQKYKNDLFVALKKQKINKISFAKDGKINFGNWKQVKNWIILIPFFDDYIIGHITSHSNQEFWSNLDTDLPHADMRRGIINIKLARSLMNLTDKSKIWDPFCGLGRNLVAAMDLKDEFIASDVDSKCLPELTENYQKAEEIYANHQTVLKNKYFPDSENIYICDLKNVFTLNSINLTDVHDNVDKDWIKDCAIVTEGYLGKNFTKKPDMYSIKKEWKEIYAIWSELLKKAKILEIKQIIFCLPFYPNAGFKKGEPFLPDFLPILIKDSDYKIENLGDFDTIQYSRDKSNTGHLIVKLVLDK